MFVILAFAVGTPFTHAQPVAALPDLNGDGVADYFMRIPVWSADTPVVGQFRVFSGADHSLLKGFTSLQVDDGFATTTSSAGDIDGDGVDEVIVGAPLAIADGLPSGKIYLVSGTDGAILNLITTPAWSYGGMTVAGLGDIDGDGVRDIAYTVRGATGPTVSGFVVVHSVGLDEPVMLLTGIPGDISFGYAIAYLGDTNGDQSPEIAVSAPDAGGVDNARGSVLIFECRDLNGELVIEQAHSDARLVIENATLPSCVFGGAMYLGPDIDGDGARELVVGSTVYTQFAEVAVIEAYDLATAARVESLTIEAQKLKSDVNGDLVVDHLDIAAALDLMDLPADPLNPKSGDIDGDGMVGADDVVSVIQNLDHLVVTPQTFSNGQRAEVIDLVTSLLTFSGFSPCMGTPPGLVGGVGGIIIPPDGPEEGGLLPIDPINPVDPACCLYKILWLGFPPEERPPPPPGCEALGGGGPGSPPRPKPPGWSDDDEGGEGSDPPPNCDGMSIVGPAFVELGKSATYQVYGTPSGFLMWDVRPFPGTLQPLGVSTQPTYLVKGVQVGTATVFAGVFGDEQTLVCAETFTVQVVDCSPVTIEGPTSITVGATQISYVANNLAPGMSVNWHVDGDLALVSSSPNSVAVRGKSAGVGRIRGRVLYNDAPLSCDVTIDVPVVCDFRVLGPNGIAEGQTAVYIAEERYQGQRVRWTASGPIEIVGSSEDWSVAVLATGCGAGQLTARLLDEDGLTVGCVANAHITVQGAALEPVTITGLPPDGYLQLEVAGDDPVLALSASGNGTFTWEIVSSVEGAVEVEESGLTCSLTISEPTLVSVRLTREYCGNQSTVTGSFNAFVFDLAIDSNNDGAITIDDDLVETDGAGHIILATTLDADADGIPDYADGIGLIPNYEPASTLSEGMFSSVVVTVSSLEGLPFNAIDLNYRASDPAGIHISDTEFFARPEGAMRLWRVPATTPRNPLSLAEGGDYIPRGLYTLETLGLSSSGGEVTLYLEAIRPSLEPGGNEIQIELVAFGADAGADGPAHGPNDLVAITTTEIEILGRGKRDTEFYPIDVFTPTELPPADFPGGALPDHLQWGAWQTYVIRVHDPRPGFTSISVGGQTLPLISTGAASYVTAPFLCLDPEDLPDGTPPGEVPVMFPAGYTAVWLAPGSGVEIRYNPDGRIVRSKGLLAVTDETAELVDLINTDIVPEMESQNWVPDPAIEPPNDGSFGKEVHRRITQRLHNQNPRFLADVVIDKDTLQIISIAQNIPGTTQMPQIDILALEAGYSPEVGDTLDRSKVKFAFEVKTGIGGYVDEDQKIKYINIFGEEKFRSLSSKRQWLPHTAWRDTPKVKHLARAYSVMNNSATKKLRNAALIGGAAIPIIALVDLGEATTRAEELAAICDQLQFVHPDDYDYGPLVFQASFKMGQVASALGADGGPSLIFSHAVFLTIYGRGE